jgi:hypothetical protein
MVTYKQVDRAGSTLIRLGCSLVLGAMLLVGCSSSQPSDKQHRQFESDCLAAPKFAIGRATLTDRGEMVFAVPTNTLLPNMDSLNSVCRVMETDGGIRLQECQVRIIERRDSLAMVVGVEEGYIVLGNHWTLLREFAKSDIEGTRRSFLRPVLLR